MKGRPTRERLGFALAGIAAGWRREHSFRTHVWTFGAVLPVLLVVRPAAQWWAAYAIVAMAVLGLELVNGAVEALADLVEPARHPEIKAIKDMMSGAVMLAGFAAIAVGVACAVAEGPRVMMEWGL